MSSFTGQALDAVDEFIKVGNEIASFPIWSQPEHREAAEDLYQISKKLLDANENMARWLNRFVYFDFRVADPRTPFLQLLSDYRTAKAGGALRTMKFNCGEILTLYQTNVAPRINEVFQRDPAAGARAHEAFATLGDADQELVNFIYQTVVDGIDRFLSVAEDAIDKSNRNEAERRRLSFKAESAVLSERLERLGGGLSELILRYAQLARRPVTLD